MTRTSCVHRSESNGPSVDMAYLSLAAFTSPTLPPSLHGVRTKSVDIRRPTTTRCSAAQPMSRRAVLGLATAAATAFMLPNEQVLAEDVVPYTDLPKGFKLMRPNGWNEFAGTPDQYDIKWADVIQPLEYVQVLTTPTQKPLSALGDAASVGARLAASRGGELVAAEDRDIEGVPAYVLEIKKGGAHQLTLLTVNKAKLYSLTASSGEKRWPKREKLLRSVVASFQPKL